MAGFKVKYLGADEPMVLTRGKEYKVTSIERGWYRIETDMLGDYLFPAELFEAIA